MTFDLSLQKRRCRGRSALSRSVIGFQAARLPQAYKAAEVLGAHRLRRGAERRRHDLRPLLPLHPGAVLRAEQPPGRRRHASGRGRGRGSGADPGRRARPGRPRLQTNRRRPDRPEVQSHRRLRKRLFRFIRKGASLPVCFHSAERFFLLSKPHKRLSHEIRLSLLLTRSTSEPALISNTRKRESHFQKSTAFVIIPRLYWDQFSLGLCFRSPAPPKQTAQSEVSRLYLMGEAVTGKTRRFSISESSFSALEA